MTWTVKTIYQELLDLGDEHSRIEAKRASDIGNSIMQTVCAFANEPGLGGGYMLFGVAEPDESHSRYWVIGVAQVDKVLNELQNNCRHQFENPVSITTQIDIIDGKQVIGVYVPEISPSAKPCRFVGHSNKHNKRKTGVWRRGANGDYECTDQELEPILFAKSGISYEQTILPDSSWDDLDPTIIALYRQLRARIKPNAEELQTDDQGLLTALHLVKKQNGEYKPNIAGLLLMAKPLALRRLLPVVRVDYVRINGTQWVEDPNNRFSITLDFLEPLIRLIPKLESTILDDMPRHFQLKEGQTQRSDQPILPQKVIREATVNALMHRDYHINQPILIARYSNRLEILNPGYSLKPENELGEMGSRPRNPIIASVLYDLGLAETKGSGIRTMRRLLQEAGLTPPAFISNREANQFTATYLLDDLLNAAKLSDGSDLHSNGSDLHSNGSDLHSNGSDLHLDGSDLPEFLDQMIVSLTLKSRKENLWPVILHLCALKPRSAEELAKLLHRKANPLKTKNLNKMRKEGLITYVHPEVINHPEQAYEITDKGRSSLRKLK